MNRPLLTLTVCALTSLLTACGSITGLQDAKSDFACSVDLSPRCASLSSVHESLDKEEMKPVESLSGTVVISDGKSTGDPIVTDTPLMDQMRTPE